MCRSVVCVCALLVVTLVVKPLACGAMEDHGRDKVPLCGLVRDAGDRPRSELEIAWAGTKYEPREPGVAGLAFVDSLRDQPPNRADARTQRKLFQAALADWSFFEDLAYEQQNFFNNLLLYCENSGAGHQAAAQAFSELDASQRATFVAITHAMLNTRIIDGVTGADRGDALQLVERLIDIHGENNALPSDQQFQMAVVLRPGALQELRRARNFEKGENHVFHPGYPRSFRQLRAFSKRGEEAGLHVSVSSDGRTAEIHIDYRFGLWHLSPANSDIRAQGNHQKHFDRWPQVDFAVRTIQVRRVVLGRRQETQAPVGAWAANE